MRLLTKARPFVFAGCAALGLAASIAPAAAHTYVRCDYDGDRCVRIHCDWDGDECWRESAYYSRPYYYGSGRWACDEDGDDCRWVYYRHPYYDRPHYHGYYYGPSVSLGIGF